MTVQIIPTSTEESNYTQITAMDGRDYELEIRWNQREARWYLAIRTATDGLIQGPTKIVADWPLVYPGKDLPLPPGCLMAVDTTGEGRDPGLAELGERVVLVYLDAEELGLD
jgi:hypothetical protein